jgi:formylglycine-generating enzyme required for sulfatase activity
LKEGNMQKLIMLFTLALVAPIIADASAPIREQPKDPPKKFANSIGMKFVWIPPGNFMMGSQKEEKERKSDEIQHKVTLTKGFYMGPCDLGWWTIA